MCKCIKLFFLVMLIFYFLFFQTVEAGDVYVVKIVAPPGVNFNNEDTLPFINAKVKNFSCNPETISDTFRIGNGIARVTERVILAPGEERLLTFVNWVRDRIYLKGFVSETTGEFPICDYYASQMAPAIAFDGRNYLVVWEDCRYADQEGINIYGARVTPQGIVLDTYGFPISRADSNQSYPAVAFGNSNYLVVWSDNRNGYSSIYGARVSPNGIVLDPNGILICDHGSTPAVAFDGINWFVVWQDGRHGNLDIYGARISQNGEVLDPDGIPITNTQYDEGRPSIAFGNTNYLVCWVRSLPEWSYHIYGALISRNGTVICSIGRISPKERSNFDPRVAFGGRQYLVVWQWFNPTTYSEIWGRRVSLNGTLVDTPFCIAPTPAIFKGNYDPNIAFDGKTYLIVWSDGRNRPGPDSLEFDIYARRVSPEGILIEPELLICGVRGYQGEPAVAFGTTNFLIAWSDDRHIPQYPDIYGRLIEATLISNDATYPNQGRHLARVPNTSDLDWTYHTNIGVFWQWRGEHVIGEPRYLGRGKYPSISIVKEPSGPSRPWTWIISTTGHSLCCYMKRMERWKKFIIDSAEQIGAPSVVLSQINETYPMGYVVYTARPPFSNSNYLYFAAFDDQIDTACYYKIALDTGEIQNGGAIYTPSIAITPGDYLHVVWCKEGKVWYKTTLQPVHPDLIRAGIQPVWSRKVLISTQDPMTEPASNPFVEASGEWVYCVWRCPNEEGNPNYGEIWQRKGRIRRDSLPYWYPPRNISKSPLRESNYPTMSTGNAVVWQELLPDSNFEIYANLPIPQETVNISRTPNNSFYPHTNLLPAPPHIPYEWELFSIWTEEEVSGIFKVNFSSYYFQPPSSVEPAVEVLCGKNLPSPYCVSRDSFLSFGEISIDYASSNLLYKIPYLNPEKYYLLEAVVYHEAEGLQREVFIFEDGSEDTIEFYPAEPETLRVIIPKGTYNNTTTNIKVKKLLGEFAAVANLRLYEFEIIDNKIGGPQDREVKEIPLKTLLFSPYPNPFLKNLRIKYRLSKASRVSLKLYDIAGQEVRTLMNGKREPGVYMVNFNGKGLSPGVYFIRLETEEISETKKILLMR